MSTALVIFDCDGVLVDSDRISLRIQAERISALGIETTYEDCVNDFLGLGMPATLRILAQRLGRPVPEKWARELETAVREAFEHELALVPGIVEALDAIELPTCVASSGSHEKMRFTLGLTGLYDRFAGRIFSADEVERGKPAPDLFLHAAARMGVAAEDCVVVEDSPFGVEAAKAAGMRVLGFAATAPQASLTEADAVFTAMAELPVLLGSSAVSDDRVGEPPLPLYGLENWHRGERFIEGEGWDIRTVVHCLADEQGKVTVGVYRRTTARPVPGGPRVAIPPELARQSVATTLAASLPSIGNDVFEVADEVAGEEDAWRPCVIEVDGEPVGGYERSYRDLWIAYYLTPTLIVHVLAPVASRPDAVKLRKLEPNEVRRRSSPGL